MRISYGWASFMRGVAFGLCVAAFIYVNFLRS
jgi:hypothetical protein